MWVEGLVSASRQKANASQKNRLLNEAETTKSFFSSLKHNKFPDASQVHGASIKFWRSWVESSAQTMDSLAALNKNILVLLSDQDVFSAKEYLLKNQKYLKYKHRFALRIVENADRNFISDGHLADKAGLLVADFVKKLKE